MTDTPEDQQTPDAPAVETPELPEEWKPEPREWNWKDVFTAPMLAFKPKCMLISLVTVALLGLYGWGAWEAQAATAAIPVVGPALCWLLLAFGAVLFGMGSTLVSIFYKADLLDDEFLSLGEAFGQFKNRCKAAILVPLFMIGIVAGFNLAIYLAELICSIPVVGGFIYAILYPLGWLLSLFTVLLSIGTALALFVGPAVIAVRKHGWFDNVIDTFEAVGTKPHQLVSNMVLTLILVGIAYAIPQMATTLPASFASGGNLPTHEVLRTELGSESLKADMGIVDCAHMSIAGANSSWLSLCAGCYIDPALVAENTSEEGGVHKYGSGLILFGWKVLILGALVGYLLNVWLAGGMLTYLAIREDDYWDDEDLEDLDQLAKELEEEARREAEALEKGGEPAPAQPTEEAAGDSPATEAAESDKASEPASEEDTGTEAKDAPAKEAEEKEDNPTEEAEEAGDKTEPEQAEGDATDKEEPASENDSEEKDKKDGE